jgi:hypothetical protein
MRPHLAALVTACFAAAVSTPQVGVVVHHHAGGELPHVHADLDDDAPQHVHHHDASDLDDDDHDHPEDQIGAPDPASEGPGLHVAWMPLEWHTHATSPFHRATPPRPMAVARPQAVALLNVAAPPSPARLRAITSRSRGPPPRPCSQDSAISF